MNFLTPLFLLGTLAIAGPILFHLIRRTTRERTVFSSLLFLQPTPPRLTRRSRIEHWLLLLLRCLALGLLAFGFARPFLPKAAAILPASTESKRVVLLVDTSASLQRSGAWETVRTRVADWTRRLSGIEELAVLTFDRTTQSRLDFTAWKSTAPGDRVARIQGLFQEIEPGWKGTELGQALIRAAELLNEPSTGPEPRIRQIILLSDLQEGGHPESLQAYDWPRGVELILDAIPVRPPGNAGLQPVTEEPASAGPGSSNAVVRVRVSNTADSTQEQFEVGWLAPDGAGLLGTPLKAYVPPGQSRTLSLTVPEGTPSQRIQLRGDGATFDNTVFVTAPPPSQARVTYVGADLDGENRQPLFFLQRAFPTNSRPSVLWTTRPADQWSPEEARNATGLTVVTAPPSTGTAAALREGVQAGGTVLWVVGAPAGAASLGELIQSPGLTATESTPGSFALMTDVALQHPLFAPFADPRFGDFSRIRIWKHRALPTNALGDARILARLDSGSPAMVEVPVGRGRVIVWTFGWQPDESQWALSSKFVPFLLSLLEYSSALPPVLQRQFQVGDALPLPAGDGGVERRVRLPDGTEQLVSAGATQFGFTDQPGIYRVTGGGSDLEFAVNVDPAESRTLPTAGDTLERLGAPMAKPETPAAEQVQRREELQAADAEGRQKLWRWFLGATVLVLLVETAAAGWAARRSRGMMEASA